MAKWLVALAGATLVAGGLFTLSELALPDAGGALVGVVLATLGVGATLILAAELIGHPR